MTSQFRAIASMSCAALVVLIRLVNQAATGFRKLQAAHSSKPRARKPVNSCQAEIASGGALIAVRIRKTRRNVMNNTNTVDRRQYMAHASPSSTFASRAAASRGRKKIRKTNM